ncbi:ATP-binding protein [Bradyrhizobium valentinum]|uniref:ATP-binding protein n=1 Tax=Bradyrhizobium valentinum TaxID=1518501 RepID=UPI00070BBB24|nr:ATP-binding protein [Bradyrhizobium valentinum]
MRIRQIKGMANPFSSGGGGTHFEARVVAFCLAATACEAAFRGLRAEFVSRVSTQRADFGEHLDDVILRGPRADGTEASLHLQAKKTLTFTKSDDEWKSVVLAAWRSASGSDYHLAKDRLGVVIGTYSSQADKHYQSVLTWAAESADAANFVERIEKRDYSHEAKRAFVANVRDILTEHLQRPATDDEVWHLLRGFVILHFDFQNQASRDEVLAIELLGRVVNSSWVEAARGWDHLIAKAGSLIPAGGGATRETILLSLQAEGITSSPAKRFAADIAALERESRRAAADIKDSIQGLKLHRADAYERVKDALGEGRFIQIDGEPGCGKSALLKRFVQESESIGPVFLLKDSRIHPRGWSNYASTIGISDDIATLLREFARAGESILFIDGIDKISDSSAQLTVNDILRAIVATPDLSGWRVLVTIREQNLKHLETWLDPDVLKALPIKTVSVGSLNDEELSFVAAAFPRLQPILGSDLGTDVILQRPFFLETILQLGEGGATSSLPATEVELLGLWWRLGAGDQFAFAKAQRRRNALLQLAERVASAPGSAPSVRDLDEDALAELIESDVVRQHKYGHSVEFAHDIYEEWALTQLLIGETDVVGFLQKNKEPDTLIRPMQLLAAIHLETNGTIERWEALYDVTGSDTLRSVWRRAVITAPLHSVRATELLGRLAAFLQDSDGARLRRLMLAVRTSEVVPNPLFLDETLTPHVEAGDRAKFAMLLARPKSRTWIRFLNWFIPIAPSLSPTFIPELVKIFQPWQTQFSGMNVRHCRAIGLLSYGWLKEIENARHPARFEHYRKPFGVDIDDDDLEKDVRHLFLSSVGDIKTEAAEYLKATSERDNRHIFRRDIVENCIEYAKHLPAELVDFILASFLQHPRDRKKRRSFDSISDHEVRELGLQDSSAFYPASPIRLPFLVLLRWHKAEGLRLVRSLCNFAMDVWRWSCSWRRRGEGTLTPVPISVEFPWGKQDFWGTQQTYLWFRGTWGNHACESALMALEQWALEELDKGVEFNTIFKEVIEANESVAVLGIGLSLALAAPDKRALDALPLLTCPALWSWDIARCVHDIGSPPNEIGNWLQYRPQLQAVRDLNRKSHRKQDIRNLVPYVLLSGQQEAIDRYTMEVRSFPERLPVSFKEELDEPDHIAALTKQMKNFADQGDPQYWKMQETDDGRVAFFSDPPSRQEDEFKELTANHAKLNEHTSLAIWANKTLEDGVLDQRFTIDAAVLLAKAIDFPEIFDDRSNENISARQAMSAVSGVAFVVAAHASAEQLDDSLLSWVLDVLQRAATGPEADDTVGVRASLLLMHPAVFAAHGFSHLLARGLAEDVSVEALLNLAVDAMSGVQAAVFSGAKAYAAARPEVIWALMRLGLKLCICHEDDGPEPYSIAWDAREAERNLALVAEAASSIGGKRFDALPVPPEPWVKGVGAPRRSSREKKGYVRNPVWFYHHDAEKTVLQLPIEAFLSDARKPEFLRLVGQLVDAMVQEMHPPFAEHGRDRSERTPFEWIYGFSYWCGRVGARLTVSEFREAVIDRAIRADSETALMILQSALRSYMVFALLPEQPLADEKIQFWSEITEWMFALSEWRHQRRDHLDREFEATAFSLLFCAQNDFAPLICGLETSWPHFPKFISHFERVVREFGRNANLYYAVMTFFKRGGFAPLPDPGFEWLRDIVLLHKDDPEFWERNGEDTVELLKRVLSEKGDRLSGDDRTRLIAMLDTLVDGGVRGAGFVQQELSRSS